MSVKLIWTGLFFIIALTEAFRIFGLTTNKDVIVLVGAVLFLIGIVLLWLDK